MVGREEFPKWIIYDLQWNLNSGGTPVLARRVWKQNASKCHLAETARCLLPSRRPTIQVCLDSNLIMLLIVRSLRNFWWKTWKRDTVDCRHAHTHTSIINATTLLLELQNASKVEIHCCPMKVEGCSSFNDAKHVLNAESYFQTSWRLGIPLMNFLRENSTRPEIRLLGPFWRNQSICRC